MAKKARDKYVEANKIEEEAKELERQAKALVNASKIIEMNMEEERRSYYSSTKHTKRVKGVTIEFSEQFNELVDAAMMVQKEHMDLEWLKHQRDHYKSTLGRSITMEQAVETLGEVESLIKALENEHKELLEKQEEKNARTKRVCSEWEEGDAG